MKRLFLLLFVPTLAITLWAQPAIHGQVFLQNSKTRTGTLQTIPGVEIKADSAAPTTSDAQGRFTLRFTAMQDLKQARITAHKRGLVLVNEHELLSATIGGEAPLKVFLADSALLAEEQAILYDINLKVLTREKDRLIAKLKSDSATCTATIAELEERFNREFEHRWAAQDFLEEQLQHMKEQLPERMAELARVNLDFASERYVQAYKLFKGGQTELAMRLLDSLDVEAVKATERLEEVGGRKDAALAARDSVDNWARQIVASYRLKAEGHNLKLGYRKAAVVLEKGLVVLLRIKRGVEDLEVSDTYRDLGIFYRDMGSYAASQEFALKNLKIKQSLPHVDPLELSKAYSNLAATYWDLSQYLQAFDALRKSIEIEESLPFIPIPTLPSSYNNMAALLIDMGEYRGALEVQTKAIDLQLAYLPFNDPMIATSCHHLSVIYSKLGSLADALTNELKAVRIKELILDANNPDLATSYSQLALLYSEIGNQQAAMSMALKTIQIREALREPNHPALSNAFNTLAVVQNNMKDFQKALESELRALEIDLKSLGKNHASTAITYNNLGMIYNALGRYTDAAEAFLTALSIRQQTLGPIHPLIASTYYNLSTTYQAMGDQTNALRVVLEAISIIEACSGSDHLHLPAYYETLSEIQYRLKDRLAGNRAKEKAAELRAQNAQSRDQTTTFQLHLLSSIYDLTDKDSLAFQVLTQVIAKLGKGANPTDSLLLASEFTANSLKLYLESFDGAKALLETIIKAAEPNLPQNHPNLGTYYDLLAKVHSKLGENDAALLSQRRALAIRAQALGPMDTVLAGSYSNMGTILSTLGALDSAAHYLHLAYDIYRQRESPTQPVNPTLKNNLTYLHQMLGDRLRIQGNHIAALKHYEIGLSFTPEDPLLLFSSGISHFLLREYIKAAQHFELGYALDSSLKIPYLINASLCYSKLARFSEAEPLLMRLETDDPQEAKAFRNWAVFHALKGDPDQALTNLEKAIRLGYTDLNWIQAEEAFNNLHDHPRYIALIKTLKERPK